MSASLLHLPGRSRSPVSAAPGTALPLRGPGSVFQKGLRDSRRSVLAAGLGLGAFISMYAVSIATNYGTLASREEAIRSTLAVAAIGSMTGAPINAETLGGFLSWRVGNLMPLLFGAWSILALSGTIAGEARAGSLELVAATPATRRRIAGEKVAVHLAGLAVAAGIVAVMLWATAAATAKLPGDGIALGDALVHAAVMALLGLVGGAIAFAAAPWLGRAAAAGTGAIALVAAYLVGAYADTYAAFGALRRLSWLDWTARERPIAGSWDNVSLVPVAVLVGLLLAAGSIGFERRDLGSTVRVPRLTLPGRRFLLRGPARAAFLVALPAAIAWGIALGLYAWLVGISTRGYVDQFAASPEAARLMDAFFPNVAWRTAGGMLQMMFFDLGVPFLALAGAVLVSQIASNEGARRLDMLLSTRVSRARWLFASGAGACAALGVLALVVGAACAAGSAQSGDDPVRPFLGALIGSLYAAALAGIGLAVFGLGWPGWAGGVTAALAVGLTAFELVGASLRLPGWLLDLSLLRHLGQPMAGSYDWPGMGAALALTFGGLAVGAWGLRRRDLGA